MDTLVAVLGVGAAVLSALGGSFACIAWALRSIQRKALHRAANLEAHRGVSG